MFNYDDLAGSKPVWASTFAHELFHYWNAGRIQPENYPEMEFFIEGFTEYFASSVLFRNGVIDQDTWFHKLKVYMARFYLTRNLLGDQPTLREAGKDKLKNWLLVYGGGATFALILDVEILDATNGEKRLDQVMRLMEARYGGNNKTYDFGQLVAVVNEVAGTDLSYVFDKYVTGKSFPELQVHLGKAGLIVEHHADDYYLRLRTNPNAQQRKVWSGLKTTLK